MQLPHPSSLHSAEQAARALDVPPALIRKWRHVGKVEPAGMLPAPVPGGLQPMYRLDELQQLATAYHARRRARSGVMRRE